MFSNFSDGKTPSTKGRSRQDECSKKCGGTELGSTECALDPKTGLPNGRVEIQINDKHRCTRPCVEVHERIHAKDVEAICKKVHTCLNQAGEDSKKHEQCLDTYEAEFLKKIAGRVGTECKAYRAEEKCLRERKSSKECGSQEAKAHYQKAVSRLKCYKDCYCAR